MKNKSVRMKIGLFIVVGVFLMTAVNTTGYMSMDKMSNNSNEMYHHAVLPIEYLGQIRTDNRALDFFVMELMVTRDAERNRALQNDIKQREEQIMELAQQYKQTIENNKAEEQLYNQLLSSMTAYIQGIDRVVELALQNQNEAAYRLYNESVVVTRDETVVLTRELMELLKNEADDINQENQQEKKKMATVIIVLSSAVLLIFLLMGIRMSRSITSPLRTLQHTMEEFGKGNLAVRGNYQSKDEIGQVTQSFNKMADKMSRVVMLVSETSSQVAAASEELSVNAGQTMKATELVARTMENIADGANDQVKKVSETVTTIHRFSGSVQSIAQSAQQVTDLSSHSLTLIMQGDQNITQVVSQMKKIQQQVQGLSTLIQHLGDRSTEIGQIIDSITAIAAQTNLLALNAAIEAARAGEQGRGFAVVADEVRKLAEQSAQSAKQIEGLISKTQGDTTKAVVSMTEVSEEVKTGIDITSQASVTFTDIQKVMKDVTQQIEEVSASVEEMATGTDQIVGNMDMIHSITEEASAGTENASAATEKQIASMEEISSSSQSLADMAEELRSLSSQFKV